MDRIIEDKELGRLIIHVNSRAKRLIFRTKVDEIAITIPPKTSLEEVKKAIEKLRKKLLISKKNHPINHINLHYKIQADFFELSLIQGSQERFLAHSEPGRMKIICPVNANFEDEKLQIWLRKVIEEALRRNAKMILPPKLYMLSEKNKLHYESVKINSSRGRWGSCSAKRNINLSYFLLLLPEHLINYVLLHELCHTKEMNHGEKFWKLLNAMTNNKALELRNELKKYKTDF